MKSEDHVCICQKVTLRKLVNYIRREQPPVASMISECLSAGTACGWCVPFIRRLHRDVMAGRYDSLDQFDFAEYEKLRAGWIDQLKPGRDIDRFPDEMCQPTQPPAGQP